MKKRTLSLVLALVMLLTLVPASLSLAEEEIVTLQVFSMQSNASGLQDNSYWAEILRRDLGIQIELMPAGDQAGDKLNSYMANNQLPDIVVFKDDYKLITNAIEAGLLVNLDEHQDKLPNVYANALNGIEYFRDNVSNKTGAAYAVPNSITTQSSTSGITNSGPYLRWDLYKQLGYPVINELEDYLPVLQQMLALEPTNPDGQKNYGISIWSDWDGKFCYPARVVEEFYGVSPEGFGFQERNFVENTFTSIFDDASYYKRALKFYFSANQMGILDPDSLTHGWGDFWDKTSAGRVMFSFWSWGFGTYATAEKDSQGIGFKPVYFTAEKQYNEDGPKYIGSKNAFAIGKDTKNLDKALAFIDYMYSYDGLWNLALGDKGVFWDLDESGAPYRTELGWKMKDEVLEFENGGLVGDGLNTINAYGMPWFVKHPVYGYRMDEIDWQKADFAPADSTLVVEWREKMGANDDLDYLTQHDLLVQPPFAPMPPVTDEVEQIMSRVGDMVKTESWKMIFAKDEAEFESLFDAMGEKAQGMGVETADNWVIENYNAALESGAKYMK